VPPPSDVGPGRKCFAPTTNTAMTSPKGIDPTLIWGVVRDDPAPSDRLSAGRTHEIYLDGSKHRPTVRARSAERGSNFRW
jgi:hypothetical protein